jgi:hypothetical protein
MAFAGFATIALVAIALAGRPVARHLGANPAATPTEAQVGAPVTLDSITLVGSPEPEARDDHALSREATATGAVSATPSAAPPSPPPPRPAPPARRPAHTPDDETTPPSTLRLTYEPTPASTPASAAPPAESSAPDNRALFEERK